MQDERPLDAWAIRQRVRLPSSRYYPPTQTQFAALLGVPVGTVKDWEQGRRKPGSAARTLLVLMERAPAETLAALGKAAQRAAAP